MMHTQTHIRFLASSFTAYSNQGSTYRNVLERCKMSSLKKSPPARHTPVIIFEILSLLVGGWQEGRRGVVNTSWSQFFRKKIMKNKLIYVQFLGKIDVFQTSKIQQTTEICY